ncbi:PatB family C-S lyase [Lentimicrobium sp.]|uniref:MalY/PatB family protein n=2 Tax=Lentimicrobium sp. TaxID=2034841 RepID=UPI002C73BCC1|nr:PatB family C-S lyase [Lentimicrobium sp.]HPJ63328.1 PatB family C-S lyase [Lentimicrobium sp.]HPR25545.1 PatB family C-S lyase [Lentimicrobium sp.]HRW68689.1 PatB family C-S lyase [Lentimicrobium sp.]
MQYNFDEIIDRGNTACVKYDLRKFFFGNNEVIPMWVADMDFRTPDFVMDAIRKRAAHEVLGYSIRTDSYFDALTAWIQRRHHWRTEREWIAFSPGIVPAVNMAVLAFTLRRDKVIIQPPVYFPFFDAVKNHNRKLVYNQLIMENGRYRMNYENLEQLCRDGARMLILSNPHNPAGNAWRADELQRMADICLKYNVLMISDEIHCDLVNRGYKHTVLASLSPEIAANTVTMVAPSKTFNLAGMATSSVIISNPSLMKRFRKVLDGLHIEMGNLFGNVAAEAAYMHGDAWLEQLLDYIDGNIHTLIEFAETHLPQVKVIRPEATYMAWLDFSQTGMSDAELKKFAIEEAGLGLNEGTQFGPGGDGYMRMNLACPRPVLMKALKQLKHALGKRMAES